MKKFWTVVLVIAGVFAMVNFGCSKKNNISIDNSGTTIPTTPPTGGYSRPAGWIDDCEDGASVDTGNVCDYNGDNPGPNVGGYWITFDDDDWSKPYAGAGVAGSTVPAGQSNCGTSYVWPMSQTWSNRLALGLSAKFTMSQPGFPASPYGGANCARITGYVTMNTTPTMPVAPLAAHPETQTGFAYGFIGMGVQLTSTAGSPTCVHIDISGFTGVQFWARSTSNGGAGASFECKLPYTPTTNCDDPILGTLDQYNDYAYHFTATSTWTKYTVPFVGTAPLHFAQATGWGGVPPGVPLATVLANASAIQWQTDCQCPYFLYPNQVELEIDDVQLYH